MTLERYRRELDYDGWANGEVLRHLQRESSPPASCVRWLAHVLGAQALWLARLEGRESALGVWPTLTLDELETRMAEQRTRWIAYLERLSPADLARSVAYTNTKGQPWSSRVEDVLTHVVLHGAYHRGQVASALREANLSPPYTDYIHAVRQGHVP
jgi:uncharacterized damage-inducible protein DinB